MEISSPLGIILSIIAIIGGMIFKGAPISALLNPAAFLIIFVGTASALAMAFPMTEFKKVPTMFKVGFKKAALPDPIAVIKQILEWAAIARREGILMLEAQTDKALHPFMGKGLRLLVDGVDKELMRDIMETEIEAMKERHKMGATIFAQGGTYAPTLGVMGAVVGLVAALGNMNDIEKLGHAIAAAFIATMFGIYVGYVIMNPLANKVKRMSHAEVEIKTIMVEGLYEISNGTSANILKAKLSAYLDAHEAAHLEEKK